MKDYLINAAIQLLPGGKKEIAYHIIDQAIEIISQSKLNYKVCPFETVVEGTFLEIMEIVEKIRDISFQAGADDIIINLKLQFGKDKNILI
jgi:uncharacterized protein YqgV (UPF0045/DUF77 family)